MIYSLILKALIVSCKSFRSNKTFDITYINLNREISRREHMENLLRAANCSFNRFDAVDGVSVLNRIVNIETYVNQHFLDLSINISKYNSTPENLKGMVGCKLSHYLLMKKIEMSGTKRPVLILEDDVDLECDFVKKIEKNVRKAPKDWDLIIITEHYQRNTRVKSINGFIRVFSFIECIFLVNGSKSAKKIANLVETRCKIFDPIDDFLAQCSMNQEIQVYAMKNKLAIQMRKKFRSAIPSSWEIHPAPLRKSLFDYTCGNKTKKFSNRRNRHASHIKLNFNNFPMIRSLNLM